VTQFRIRTLALLLVTTLAVPALAAPQDIPTEEEILRQYVETARGDLRAKRNSALEVMIDLDADEAEVFWPIKQEYDKDSQAYWEARLALVKEYAGMHESLTTETANDLARRVFELEARRTELRRTYFKRLSAEVSTVVAVQFLQVQSQFDSMADLKLATIVPLAVK
jgi:hypothetical protein